MTKPFNAKAWIRKCLKQYPEINSTDGRLFIVFQPKWKKSRSAMKLLKPFLDIDNRRIYFCFGHTSQKKYCEWHYGGGKDYSLIKKESGYDYNTAVSIITLANTICLPITQTLSDKNK